MFLMHIFIFSSNHGTRYTTNNKNHNNNNNSNNNNSNDISELRTLKFI